MTGRAPSTELVPAGTSKLPLPAAAVAVLALTPNAAFAAQEFFKASISNDHTPGAPTAGSSAAS